MKRILVVLALSLSTLFYAQEKVYYTENFKELRSPENATYYSTYEKTDHGTDRKTYYVDGTIRNADQFSNMKKKILDGTSETFYKNGQQKLVINYKAGKKEGTQSLYYESGILKRNEIYKDNLFVSGNCYDETGNEIAFFDYYEKPQFNGGLNEFYKYIVKNYKSLSHASGTVKASFVVDKDGSLSDIVIHQGVNPAVDAEVMRLLQESPKWIPGKVDGEIASVKFGIPITIK